MKNTASLLLSAIFFLLIVSCKKENQKKEQPIDTVTTVDTDTEVDTTSTNEYKATDDDIREFGIIEDIEDGAYPFFSVTVNFVERKMKQSFTVNIEAVSIDSETLLGLKGKYATIYYTSDLENDLNDLHFKGKTLFGEYAPEMDASWKKTTGVLSGANSLSGDLPGKITITDSKGKKIVFEEYVDDEMMKVNGKTVTSFYSLKAVNKITHIEPSTED